jgi:hypothetical protein
VKEFLVIAAVAVAGMGGLFGFIYLLDRKSKVQSQTGRPSRLIRASALVLGMVGLTGAIGVAAWIGLRWWVLPLSLISLILVAYGLFGWFATVRPPPK